MILVPFGPGVGGEGGEGSGSARPLMGSRVGASFCTAILHRSQTLRLYKSYVTPLLNLLSHLSELGRGQDLFSVLSQHSDRLKAFVIKVGENTKGKGKTLFFSFFLKF